MADRYDIYKQIETDLQAYTHEELMTYVNLVYDISQANMGSVPKDTLYQTGHLKEDSWFNNTEEIGKDVVRVRFGYDTLLKPPRQGKKVADYAVVIEEVYGLWTEWLEYALQQLSTKAKGQIGQRISGRSLR
jgi:hypothetical protein